MKKYTNKFYCFSPPVMAFTFIIEMVLFVYTLVRYKMTPVSRLAAGLIFCLAIFQLAEYNVCGRFGISVATWSRLGYIGITLLPALSLDLLQKVAQQGSRWLVRSGYVVCAFWVGVFGFRESAFTGHVCAGNYAIFQLGDNLGGLYFTYYYALLFIGIAFGLYYSVKTSSVKVRQSLILLVAGYLSFILPTAVTNSVKPETINGIPSIMCGFAILYALMISFGVLPTIVPLKRKTKAVK